MPMDGLTLGFATREMNAILPGGRIDRITQPEKDTIVLLVRAGAANHRLLLCASPNNARCHFTNLNFPNPLEPPMFCMLLRKQILSGRILSIQQMHGDRVIHVDIDTVNELGDHVLRRLVLEIMGRHSNLMLLDEDGRILEAARHVSADMSRVRQIQPGLPYLPPPAQDKIAPEDADAENLLAKLEAQGDVPLQKALAASVSGLSNPAAKELAYRVLPAGCDRADNLPETAARLAELLRRLPQMADPRVLEDEQGEPADIFPFPYLSRDLDRQKPYPTVSQALERYFGARDQQDRINQKSASMVKLLKGQIERCEKKLAQQEEDLSSAARMDEYRIMGEIINANLWQLKKGQTEATLPNFYDENGGSMTIPLDNQLTPVQNAQRYFKKYQKARTTREIAAEQKEKTLKELDYLEGTLLDVGKCIGESELEEIRQDLMRTGYIRKGVNRRQQKALPKSKPYHYRSTDGIDIYGIFIRQGEAPDAFGSRARLRTRRYVKVTWSGTLRRACGKFLCWHLRHCLRFGLVARANARKKQLGRFNYGSPETPSADAQRDAVLHLLAALGIGQAAEQGALPQPHKGRCPLCPLTPFRD